MSGMNKELVLKFSKGFRGRPRNTIRAARGGVNKAMQYAYRDRKQNTRHARSLWIMRINAAAREHGFVYSTLMHGFKEANISLNRKMLSQIAISEPLSFASLVHQVKQSTAVLPRPQPAIGYVKSGLAVNIKPRLLRQEAKQERERMQQNQ